MLSNIPSTESPLRFICTGAGTVYWGIRAMVELDAWKDTPVLTRRNGASHTPLAEAGEAIERALRSGATREEILFMLELKVTEHEVAYQDTLPAFPDDDRDTVYIELPPGLIDVPTASRKYNVPDATLRGWIKKGRLHSRGRLKGPAARGGFQVVDEDELVQHIAAPRNKGGRPRKTYND